MNNNYGEAIKIIKEEINIAKQGVEEGYIKVGLGLLGEKVDNKKAIPQLEEVLRIVKEENKGGEFLMNENTKNLLRSMQKEINKLNKTITALKSSGEKERELERICKEKNYKLGIKTECFDEELDDFCMIEIKQRDKIKPHINIIKVRVVAETKPEAIGEALRKLEGK